MSQKQVLATVDGLLKDAVRGLTAKATALAAGDPTILTDFNFVRWALGGTMQPATKPNVMSRPGSWTPQTRNDANPHRDAFAAIEIGYEFFGADPDAIQANVALVATALAQVIDELVQYSVDTGGTVVDVQEPIEFLFGQFAGPTSHGFLARVTVFERSSE